MKGKSKDKCPENWTTVYVIDQEPIKKALTFTKPHEAVAIGGTRRCPQILFSRQIHPCRSARASPPSHTLVNGAVQILKEVYTYSAENALPQNEVSTQ